MKKLHFILLYFCVAILQLQAQPATSNEVDILVEKAMKEFNVAGVAVAVVKDGKVIHSKGYGIQSIETKIPVNEHTNFQIASNSKAFTTAALSILIDEGKITWKDKVKNHIPEFKMYNDYVTENFLIEDLLCHRSGLGLGVGDLMFHPDGADFTINDVVTSFQYFKPVSAFRTQYDYDNLLYVVAGEIIARVSGMTWEQFIETRIMTPLQMDNSGASIKGVKDSSSIATPHSTVGADNKIRTINLYKKIINGAAGGILSNVDDMSKWMLMQLNQGKYGDNLDKQLFSKERQQEMWTIHTVTKTNSNPRHNTHFSGYGLGWNLKDIKGNLSVSHTGGQPGMLSYVSLVPDLNLGIVILTNTGGGGALFTAVHNVILDSYLGIDKTDYIALYSKVRNDRKNKSDDVTKNVWKQVELAKNTKINEQDYIGIYEDNWFGKVEVFLKDKQLWIKCHRSPRLNGSMAYYNAYTFAIKWEFQDMSADAFAMFTLDQEGKAQSIKMKGISPNIDFSYDFHDLDLKRVKK